MTRFSVESAQLKEQATRHLGGPVVTAGAAAFRFQGAVQGIDLTPLTHTIGSSIAALPAPLATGLAHLPPLPNSLDLSTQRSGNTSSVSAILPIYTGGATTAIKQALQAKTEEARADGRQVQQEVFNEFVQRYFGDILTADKPYHRFTGVEFNTLALAISANAPHPNAAKLWMEYLYSDEGQLGWLKGYCHPARFNAMSAAGKIPKDLLDKLPPAEAYAKAVFPSLDEVNANKAAVTAGWDSTVGANVQ